MAANLLDARERDTAVTGALLFPGQASQEVGMGVALRQVSRRADELFDLVDRISGLAIGELCANGPLDELTRTDVAQLAVVVTSLAAAAVLEEVLGYRPAVAVVAGHSVGELAAMCWAGALDLETTLRLVHQRGLLMQRDSAACDGTMVAVIGLDEATLLDLCVQASQGMNRVQVANLNGPGLTVLSGDRTAIMVVSELVKAAGARRVLPLTVGGPFHSEYMAPAAQDFALALADAQMRDSSVPVVLNTSARSTSRAEDLRAELAMQISQPVRWHSSQETMAGLGCDMFVELGAGQVLTGLNRRMFPGSRALAAGDPDAIAEVAALLRQEGVQ